MTRFRGRLGIEDMQRHIPHRVEVPEGTRALSVAYALEPAHPGLGPLPHQVSVSVAGPNGSRGAQHNLQGSPLRPRTISEGWASPGYTPGPIEPGTWTVDLDVFRVLPPGGVEYELTVALSDEPAPGPAPGPAAATAPRGPGWYLGDLHGHTDHSDGRWGVEAFVAHARAEGLDFVTLTDHNTVSGQPHARALAGDDLLVMGGVEVTGFHGHCLALGAEDWVDWKIRDGQTMTARAEAIMAAGHTFVVAHPMATGHPWCAGCHWEHADVYPGPARLVEVWNGDWRGDKNELGLRLLHAWLNAGHRMRATAGSDIHGPPDPGVRHGRNRVWARALSRDAILEGLRAGHNVITSGPILEVACGEAIPGDIAPTDAGAIDLRWGGVPSGAVLRLTGGARGGDGARTLWEEAVEGRGRSQAPLSARPGDWVVAELRCAEGRMLSLANPLFFGGDWR